MNSRRVRIGIIGCGQIAQHHMKAYSEIPDAEMVVFCDLNLAAAQTSAEKFGVTSVTSDFREVLAREDIDAVDVCLHNNFHMPLTVAGLQAGKHVYCEKPMAGSYRDAATMLEVARETGKHLHIQLAMLYTDDARAALELIQGGHLGEIYHARSSGFRRRGRPFVDGYGTPNFVQKRQASGGALYDMGVYHISQILYLMGNPAIERISGKTYQRVEMDAARQASSQYDVEEFAAGFVRLAGNRSMEIVEAWAANLDTFEGSFLLGEKAGVRLAPFGFFQNLGNLDLNATANLGGANFRWRKVQGDGDYYSSSQAHWIAALQGKVSLLPTAEVALNTMLISEGIYLSESRGREVATEEVIEASVSTAIAV